MMYHIGLDMQFFILNFSSYEVTLLEAW